MPRATLEQSLKPGLKLQKEKVLQELRQHRESIDTLIQELEKVQTLPDCLSLLSAAISTIERGQNGAKNRS